MRHGIVVGNVYVIACYWFIRVISFHKSLHLTPFCTNSVHQRITNILTCYLFLWRHFLQNQLCCCQLTCLLPRMFFVQKHLFVNWFVRDERHLYAEVPLHLIVQFWHSFKTFKKLKGLNVFIKRNCVKKLQKTKKKKNWWMNFKQKKVKLVLTFSNEKNEQDECIFSKWQK